MCHITHVYSGEAYWWSVTQAKKTEDEKAIEQSSLATAITHLHSLCNANTPIFTRDSIKDVDAQLDRYASTPQDSRRGKKITIRALDGNTVDFLLESGLVLPEIFSLLDEKVIESIV
jgi:hypothetical protein